MRDDSPSTMSVPEAGRRLGLSRNSAYAAAARGEIPTMSFGKLLRVPVPAFEQMLKGERTEERPRRKRA